MKKIYIILLVTGFTFIGNIQAQVFNLKQDSLIQTKIITLVKDYEYYGVLTENDRTISQDLLLSFKKLFTSNAKVYNDLIPGKPKVMSINDYLRNIINYFPTGLGLTVKVTKVGKPVYVPASGKYSIPVTISKDVFGTDKNGKPLDMSNVENEMSIVFNKQLTSFKINEIKEKQITLSSLILTFIDVDKGRHIGGIKVNLVYNDKVMQSKMTNKSGKVVFNKIPNDQRVSITLNEDQGYTTTSNVSGKLVQKWANSIPEKRQVYLKHDKKWQKFGFEVFGEFTSSSINMNTVQNNFNTVLINNDGNFVINGGINIGYYFKADKKSAIGIKTGIHFDTYSSDMKADDYSQNEITGLVDSEHDSYNLLVSASNVTDGIKLSYVGVPVLFSYRKWITNPMLNYVFADVGIKASFMVNGTSSLNGVSSYSGYYPEWDITIKNVNYLNYYNDKSFSRKSDLNAKPLLFSAIISAGVSVPLKKPEFSIIATFDFGYSLNNVSNYDTQEYYLSPNQQEYNSLAGASEMMKPVSFGFHIGIHYDLFK